MSIFDDARLGVTLSTLLIQGCVFVPKATEIYDPDYRIMTKHMELEPVQIIALGSCSNEDCAVLLAAEGATAAANAVISGAL